MRNKNHIPFNDRLYHLMQTHDINNQTDLARSMIEKGLITVNPEDPDSTLRNNAKTIGDHLKYDHAEKLSGKWIHRYCLFFNCSADYLLGYISSPTHEVSTVHDITGLSEKAIRTLSILKEYDQAYPGTLNATNVFFEDPNFIYLMKNLLYKFSAPDPMNYSDLDLSTKEGFKEFENHTSVIEVYPNQFVTIHNDSIINSVIQTSFIESIDRMTKAYKIEYGS